VGGWGGGNPGKGGIVKRKGGGSVPISPITVPCARKRIAKTIAARTVLSATPRS
jgi:hypothetical protein